MKLGRYEVVRELGKGAMGVVYLAKDPLIGRLVALKTIRPAASVDDDEAKEFQQRFMREAQAAGILSHPSIVTVHDIGQDTESGVSFIAMEYVEGQNLKELISQGKTMPYREVADFIAQIADALDYAHAKGIVHRDVKPANIMLCGDARAKITDFGIAKIASITGNLTSTGQFLGTPNYMAPEQIKGTRVDGRTDIFSLGIVLYECLVRRKPFGGDSLTSISYKIVHEGFTPLTDIDPTLPDGFNAITRKCLAKEPAQRYQRAKDLAADIRATALTISPPKKVTAVNFEQTVVALDEEKIPTLEIPFPQAHIGDEEAEAEPFPVADASPPRLGGSGSISRTTPSPRGQLAAAGLAFLKRRIPPVVFAAIVVALILSLATAMVVIDRQRVPLPPIDLKREALVERQRSLRTDADALLRQGDIEAAYKKYQELRQIAPNSPTIRNILIRLDQIRIDQLSTQQRLAQAKETFAKGQQLYDEHKFAAAIPLFEEAFHLNPSMTEAVNFLRMSRERLALEEMKTSPAARGSGSKTSRSGVIPAVKEQVPAVNAAPASLRTMFASPVNSGYVMVKANGDSVVYENLWEERKSGIFRRRVPRSISVTKELPSGNVSIEVWVVVPSLGVQEHRQLRDTFQPGVERTLVVTLDKTTKRVVVTLS